MASESIEHYKDLLIVLGTAGLVIPILLRLGLSSIVGFLVVGIALGPHVLGTVAVNVPFLSHLSISKPDEVAGLAELGVVFLLFLIGLELSPERLLTMRRLVFGFGGLQVLITTFALAAIAELVGFQAKEAFIIGMALSLSSTAIVIQLLSDEKRLGSQAGRISFAALLMQDLAVVPMLLLVNALTVRSSDNLFLSILWALAQAGIAAFTIVLIGRFALTPILRFVASTQSPELFMAIVLFIALGTGAGATLAGLSMSLGAFIAGLMLAETEYRRAIETTIEPFKGLLLGLFFLMVGLNLDLSLLVQAPLRIILAAVTLIVVKTIIIMVLGRLFKLQRLSTLEAAMLLGPGGEFAFVLFTAATVGGLFANGGDAELLLIVTLSMMCIPLMARVAKQLRRKLPATALTDTALKDPPSEHGDVIVAGFGRVGNLVASMLDERQISYIAVDLDVANVTAARKAGKKVYYGDASNLAFLHSCGIGSAKSLAITMDNPRLVDEILKTARAERPDLKIIARARDERHAIKLYAAGVTEAVPETVEASLQLGEALLVETGVPMGLAIATVHERRDGFRKLLGQPNRREELAKARRRLRNNLQPK